MAAPRTIGRYQILSRLGAGGMGVVYLAHDPNLNRRVAIKLLHAHIDHPDARRRFDQEAQSAAALEHPNIVGVYDFGEREGAPFMVMPFIEGETLAQMIEARAPLTLRQKVSILEQVCAGLGVAHERGIVHRDIKPANLIIDRQGIVKILDFGIARFSQLASLGTQGPIGTPAYMSPEQILGRKVDARSDLFSVGAVAFELLTYQMAFPGDTQPAITYQIVHQEPPSLLSVAPEVGEDLAEIVHGALSKDVDRRYQDAATLQAELQAVRLSLPEPRPTPTPTPWPHQRTPTPRSDLPPPPLPLPPTPRPKAGQATRVRRACERGWRAVDNGAWDAARHAAAEALAIDPNDPAATELDAYLRDQPSIVLPQESRNGTSAARRSWLLVLPVVGVLALTGGIWSWYARSSNGGGPHQPPGNDPPEIGSGVNGGNVDPGPLVNVLPRDSDGDGIPDDQDQCPGTPPGRAVETSGARAGCEPLPVPPGDLDGDGVPDALERCPGTPAGRVVERTGPRAGCEPIEAPLTGLGNSIAGGGPTPPLPPLPPADSDSDGIPDAQDQCQDTPIGRVVERGGARAGCEPQVGSRWLDTGDSQPMVWIPPDPAHGQGFWMDQYEVTNQAYDGFVRANAQWAPGAGNPAIGPRYLNHWSTGRPLAQDARLPVNYVNLAAAQAYCRWAGKSVPTGPQWMYAARGQRRTDYWWGQAADPRYANFNFEGGPGSAQLRAVGATREQHPFALFDILGNVMEWTSDGVLRGGGFRSLPAHGQPAGPGFREPETHAFDDQYGFRCVAVPSVP